jgi:anti-sigma B factor antagonist
MADDIGLDVERHPSHTVIRVTGYIDISTSPRLRDRILEVAADQPAIVLVDLGAIEFLDSSGLGVILNGWKRLHAQGGTLAVISPQSRITKIFEITALNLSIDLYPTVEEALAGLVEEEQG